MGRPMKQSLYDWCLEYQKWKDKYKQSYALKYGYYYLEIPYWTEKDESYKQLIDNKIKEIC